jgi:glycolate oxidase FAD binding subunit
MDEGPVAEAAQALPEAAQVAALPAPPDASLEAIVEQVRAAAAQGQALRIVGGGTKTFYGEDAPADVDEQPLAVTALRGISAYEPSELVVTVRAGTPLAELEAELARAGQWLPFEPPHYAPGGTVGGMVAAGLSGPARASAGSVRDYVLGATLLNGRAELLSFGGQVMKNVAGYDVSRLLAGSLGMLGVICEVSLKVLPQPMARRTLRLELDEAQAVARLNAWGAQPLPLQASAWWQGTLVLRLAGAQAAVASAHERMGGEEVEPALAEAFWTGLRDHTDEYFRDAEQAVDAGSRLWRLALPSTCAPLGLAGSTLIEWGGAQRWLLTDAPPETVRAAVHAVGGHATVWRGHKGCGAFDALTPPLTRIHRELKQAFDPQRLFNRGRLVRGL